MDKKINVLVIPPDQYGVGYFRSVNPHVNLDKYYSEEFGVEINEHPNLNDLEYVKQFDIVHFHKAFFHNYDETPAILSKLKSMGIVPVMDIDDFWTPNSDNPNYRTIIANKIIENIRQSSYITTTTELFAEEIRKINKNVAVLPNSIDTEDVQFKQDRLKEENKINRLRLGILCGSSHLKDIELLSSLANKLKSENLLDKCQIVLCGFDLNGTVPFIDPNDGQVKQRPILPEESVWTKYETTLTDNYKLVNSDHSSFLKRYIKNQETNNAYNDCYRRIWTKNVRNYAIGYETFDILLAPLVDNKFNSFKSELKVIEAGFKNCGIIAQEVSPYKNVLTSIIGENGNINENGNSILIPTAKNHKAWVKAIKLLVEKPEMVDLMKNNLHNLVKDKYNIKNTTSDRRNFYKSIIENKK